jgi:hypothetical protein
MTTLKQQLTKYTKDLTKYTQVVGEKLNILKKDEHENSAKSMDHLPVVVEKDTCWDEFNLMERFTILRTDYEIKSKELSLKEKKIKLIKENEEQINVKLAGAEEKLRIATDKLREIEYRLQAIETNTNELSTNVKGLTDNLAVKKKELYETSLNKSYYDKKLLEATDKDCKLLSEHSELLERLSLVNTTLVEQEHELEKINDTLTRYNKSITRSSIKQAKLDEQRVLLKDIEALKSQIVAMEHKKATMVENKRIITMEKKNCTDNILKISVDVKKLENEIRLYENQLKLEDAKLVLAEHSKKEINDLKVSASSELKTCDDDVRCIMSEKKIVLRNVTDIHAQIKTKSNELTELSKILVNIFEQLISLYDRIYTELSKNIKLKIIDFLQTVSPLSDFSKKFRRTTDTHIVEFKCTTLEDIYDYVKRYDVELLLNKYKQESKIELEKLIKINSLLTDASKDAYLKEYLDKKTYKSIPEIEEELNTTAYSDELLFESSDAVIVDGVKGITIGETFVPFKTYSPNIEETIFLIKELCKCELCDLEIKIERECEPAKKAMLKSDISRLKILSSKY